MINNTELRIGNRINYVTFGGAEECIVDLDLLNELEPHNGSGSTRMYYAIPLTEDWLTRMRDNKNISSFPDHIKNVHEAQNWYYWANNKIELKILD